MVDNRPSVLVVDDDRGMRFTLQGIIEDAGYAVCGASDGYEAIKLASENPFDLVFMDIRMPGLNGVETFLELKKLIPDSRVVMMTGFSVEELVQQALAEGAYDVLYKPMPVERVIEIIQAVLRPGVVSE